MNPLKTYLPLIIGTSALALIIAVYWTGHRAGASGVQAKWEAAKVVHASALLAQEAAHRSTERKWGEATALLVESLRGAQEILQDGYESTIADINSGALRLRGDLAGCRARVPKDTSPARGDNGASDSGLSGARQSVVIRIGRDCDAVALKLQAAQGYIRALQPR